MKILLCFLVVLLSCTAVEPNAIRVPEHFQLLGNELHIERGEVSGPLGLYTVSWRGERLLPLGYSLWSGEVNAVNGPGAALLIELYPAGSIPRDLNCERIIEELAGMKQRWLIEARWLEDALLSGNLNGFREYLPRPQSTVFDFGDATWISSDPLDERRYSASVRLQLYPGERRMYIGLNTGLVRILHLSESGKLIALDREARAP